MIRVICNQETFVYNAYHMVKAFYPSETVASSVDEKASNYVTVLLEDGRKITVGAADMPVEKTIAAQSIIAAILLTDFILKHRPLKRYGELRRWGSP